MIRLVHSKLIRLIFRIITQLILFVINDLVNLYFIAVTWWRLGCHSIVVVVNGLQLVGMNVILTSS